ncbi:MAG: type II toxin-antitoxin system RatA family toxin [Burkholderiales bacterium]|nr:type II toxin-antitoxin system RatA family toxin [Burkholderiales bacterium]
MAQVDKTVLVEYACGQMFSLVQDAEQYPRFLPWCSAATVTPGENGVVRATLHIDYHGVHTSFGTENTHRPPNNIEIELMHGPFRHLHGSWNFTPLGDSACKIQLRLTYEFSNRILEKLVGPVFGFIANSLVDAFVRRAEQLHGRR